MKKIICIILTIFCILSICGCEISTTKRPQTQIRQPVLHTQDIDVLVTNISKSHRFVKVHRYYVSMDVYSEEYNISKSFSYNASGMFITLPAWEYEKGDIVKAELHTWIYEDTGTIHKQYINKVY